VTTTKGGKDELGTPEYIVSDRRKTARRINHFRVYKLKQK